MYNISNPVVHIAFNSDEIDRVTKPIIQTKTDRAYIFTFYKERIDQETNKKEYKVDQNLQRYEQVVKILENKGIKVIRNVPERLKHIKDELGNPIDGIPVSYHDYVEIMQKISKIIFKERLENQNVDIKINLAVGSKITAIASIDCARFWDVDAIYVIPEIWDQRSSPDEPLSSGRMQCVLPPKFDMKHPPDKLIQALMIINDEFEENKRKIRKNLEKIETLMKIQITEDLENLNSMSSIQKAYLKVSEENKDNLSTNTRKKIDELLKEIVIMIQENKYGILKSKLMDILRRNNLVISRKYNHIPVEKKLTAKQLSAFYGAMNKQIIKPMKHWNLIEETDDRRNKKILLTQEGYLYLKMFENMIIYNKKIFKMNSY
ncbi:MAG: hypothetical protein GF329_17495 [Candidatus Lokiarchaeota archaeon]|nr:hypothetical protein [Candidatus Lokiarchaeota archaeon]